MSSVKTVCVTRGVVGGREGRTVEDGCDADERRIGICDSEYGGS